jgi:hypothetical protein
MSGKSVKLTTGIHLMRTKILIHFHLEMHWITQGKVNECILFNSELGTLSVVKASFRNTTKNGIP